MQICPHTKLMHIPCVYLQFIGRHTISCKLFSPIIMYTDKVRYPVTTVRNSCVPYVKCINEFLYTHNTVTRQSRMYVHVFNVTVISWQKNHAKWQCQSLFSVTCILTRVRLTHIQNLQLFLGRYM